MTDKHPRSDRTALVLLAVGLSWQGFVLHNVADLPGQGLLSPETLYPSLTYVLLTGLWVTRFRQGTRFALLCWAWLQMVGGGLISVLPLPFLPFDPEQTFRHYSFHLIYALSQLPLILVLQRRAPPSVNTLRSE